MPKFTLLVGSLATASMAFAGWLFTSPGVPDQPRYLTAPVTELSPLTPEERQLLTEVVQDNQGLQTLSVQADVVLKRPKKVSLTAEFAAERPGRSRVLLRSWFYLECDAGSDGEHVWYWFRRKDPEHVFQVPYAQAEAAGFLDPVWLTECLGMRRLDPAKATLGKVGPYLVWRQPEGDGVKVTAVDGDSKLIVGSYLYNAANELVSFSEVLDHVRVAGRTLPKRVVTGWPEREMFTLWSLKEYTVNQPIDAGRWQVPAHGALVPGETE